MIDHRVRAVAGNMRDLKHCELACIELEGGVELEQHLDDILGEAIDAREDAAAEARPNSRGRG